MQLSQPLFSFPKLLFCILNKKKQNLEDFQPFSVSYHQIYANGKQLSRFQSSFGDPNSIPTFAFITAFNASLQCLSQAPIPSSILGLIHLTSEFTINKKHNWVAPFDLTITVTNCEQTSKGLEYVIVSEFTQYGETTLINRNTMLDKNKKYQLAEQPKPISKTVELEKSIIKSWSIKLSTAWRYAKLSGDFNPIHLHQSLAKMFGLKSVLIHGMYNASKSLKELSLQNKKVTDNLVIRLNKPCFIPNEVYLKAYVTENEFGLFSKDGEDRFLKLEINKHKQKSPPKRTFLLNRNYD